MSGVVMITGLQKCAEVERELQQIAYICSVRQRAIPVWATSAGNITYRPGKQNLP
jgi:hypothetical protein